MTIIIAPPLVAGILFAFVVCWIAYLFAKCNGGFD